MPRRVQGTAETISMTDRVGLGHPYSSEIVKIWTSSSRKAFQLSCTFFQHSAPLTKLVHRAARLVADLVVRPADLATVLVVGPTDNQFRRSNSLNAGGQSDTLERLSQNAVLASSADRNPALFHGGSGGGVDSVGRSTSGERFRF
jgi:hypothetical protein